ncbi:MAG: phospholipid carrier-dependent glycosyltransferase [Novosphingobium sp.]
MQPASLFTPDRDPWRWCAAICAAFLALIWIRLHIPSKIYFDEVHYVKAARVLLSMERPQNPEHPLVGKEILAAGIALFGDNPKAWRIMPALFGTLGLFAFSRLVWAASGRALATILATLFLATNFTWFIQSRIAMLDIFMATFAMLAFWQVAAAFRWQEQARWRLALAGLFLGLSMGSKWSIVGPAMVPGLALLVLCVAMRGKGWLLSEKGGPIAGISLAEAGIWLGLLPLLVYFASFWPAFFYAKNPVDPWGIVQYQGYMVQLQDSVTKKHNYMSHWWQWVLDIRAVWYLYENVDGTQRGVVLIGNPAAMWAGLLGFGWCLWAGLRQGRKDALAFAVLYLVAIGMWVGNRKPVQFYYHYLLPGAFLMACLGLAVDQLWRRPDRWRWLGQGTLAAALALFVWFLPIISAAELSGGKKSYELWMWLPSWR